MTNKIHGVEPPEGFEAYYDNGTIKFRPIEDDPTKLEIQFGEEPLRLFVCDRWTEAYGRWNRRRMETDPRPSPLTKNIAHLAVTEVEISHPDQAWVDEALALLGDYVKFHLPQLVIDNMTAGPSGH